MVANLVAIHRDFLVLALYLLDDHTNLVVRSKRRPACSTLLLPATVNVTESDLAPAQGPPGRRKSLPLQPPLLAADPRLPRSDIHGGCSFGQLCRNLSTVDDLIPCKHQAMGHMSTHAMEEE